MQSVWTEKVNALCVFRAYETTKPFKRIVCAAWYKQINQRLQIFYTSVQWTVSVSHLHAAIFVMSHAGCGSHAAGFWTLQEPYPSHVPWTFVLYNTHCPRLIYPGSAFPFNKTKNISQHHIFFVLKFSCIFKISWTETEKFTDDVIE